MLAKPRAAGQLPEFDHLEMVHARTKPLAASAWARLLVGKSLLLAKKGEGMENLVSARQAEEIQIVCDYSGFAVREFSKRECSMFELIRDAIQIWNEALFRKSYKRWRFTELPEEAERRAKAKGIVRVDMVFTVARYLPSRLCHTGHLLGKTVRH